MLRSEWPKKLTKEKLSITVLKTEDLPIISLCNQEPNPYLCTRGTQTAHEVYRWFLSDYTKSWNLIFYTIALEDVIGYASIAWTKDLTAEIGIVLKQSAQKTGIGYQSLKLLCETSIKQGMRRLTARIMQGNEKALKCFQKVGFFVDGIIRKELWNGSSYEDAYFLSYFHENMDATQLQEPDPIQPDAGTSHSSSSAN